VAVPAQSLGTTGLFVVIGNEGGPGTDVDFLAPFYNPFVGTEYLASIGADGVFDLLLPGASTPLRFNNDSRQWVAIDVSSAMCFSNIAQLQITAAIPQVISLAGIPLATDNATLGLDATPDVALTWTSSTGPVDVGAV